MTCYALHSKELGSAVVILFRLKLDKYYYIGGYELVESDVS